MAQLQGVRVIASGSTEKKCDYLRGLAVTHVFNHTKRDDVQAVQELSDGKGVDYVYDQVAGPRFCRQFDMLATYGQIILYNYLGGYPEDKEIVHILQSRCEGCYGIRYFSIHVHDTDPEGFRKVKRKVLPLMAAGSVAPRIDRVLPLSEARRAHEMIDGGEVLGKVVLSPGAWVPAPGTRIGRASPGDSPLSHAGTQTTRTMRDARLPCGFRRLSGEPSAKSREWGLRVGRQGDRWEPVSA